MYSKTHHHQNQSNQHGHQQAPQVVHHGHHQAPHVQVHQGYHNDHYAYNHRHFYRGNGWGGGTILIGSLIVIPIFIVALLLKIFASTASLTAASMTTAGAVGATSVGGAIAFSAATFGLGALLAYGIVGLGYLYSSAKECYSNDKNVIDMLKSRVVNEDGLSFKGVMKSIGAVLWSPFLLVGGLAGMGVKAAVAAINSSRSSSLTQETELQRITTSHSQMSDLSLKKNGQPVTSTKDTVPVHISSLYAHALKKSDDLNNSHTSTSQFQFDSTINFS